MSMKSHEIVLRRVSENRIAIVNCESYLQTQELVMKAISKAVTHWVKTTDEGKEKWENSSHDLNIADLSSMTPDYFWSSLAKPLAKQGIYNLEIKLYGDDDYPESYNYDTVLVNEADLEKVEK